MLQKGARAQPEDAFTPEEEVRNRTSKSSVSKDEYSESDLEDALMRHLETFLLESAPTSASPAERRGIGRNRK